MNKKKFKMYSSKIVFFLIYIILTVRMFKKLKISTPSKKQNKQQEAFF